MKQSELKFKPGDRVKLKDTVEPIMMVKDNELALVEEIKDAFTTIKPSIEIADQQPEYTGKVNVYWITNAVRNTKTIHQDMLEIVLP